MLRVENAIAYCCEDISLIENYDKAIADVTQTWHCHHRLEIQGDITLTVKELKLRRLYYNRPASELIFLTSKEHVRLHRLGKKLPKETCLKFSKYHTGLKYTEEMKRKLNESRKGKPGPMKGRKHSEETKLKMAKAATNRILSEDTKQKISLAHKGKPTWNKGKRMSEETKKRLSEAKKGKPSPKKGKTYKQKENK